MKILVIGDIHGCYIELQALLDQAGQEQDLIHFHTFQAVGKTESDDHIALGPASAFQDVVDVAGVKIAFPGHLAQGETAAFMGFCDLCKVGS